MSTTKTAAPQTSVATDDRLLKAGFFKRLLGHPELGAVAGTVVVFLFFAIAAGDRGFLTLPGLATCLEVAAELGILAIAVTLLMIGGEFDLSVGSIIGASGMLMTLLSVHYGWHLGAAILAVCIFAVLAGLFNGYLVVRTGLPSFIVTLATLFVFRGATIGLTRLITGRTQVGGLRDVPGYETAHAVFASDIHVAGVGFPIVIVWWLVLAFLGTWMLRHTPFGNWIYGSGGDPHAARNNGVPVRRVKVLLFVLTALAASLVGVIQSVSFSGADVLRGEAREFFAIVVAVIGGTLLTGGYGSVVGAVFGALIFGMVRQGIVFTGIDADWFQVVLGAMLLSAVLINNWVRQRTMEVR